MTNIIADSVKLLNKNNTYLMESDDKSLLQEGKNSKKTFTLVDDGEEYGASASCKKITSGPKKGQYVVNVKSFDYGRNFTSKEVYESEEEASKIIPTGKITLAKLRKTFKTDE